MKILIVSGFLGAGKTTFIKALARCTGKKFAVLENEYGAAGIDGDRLNQSMKNGEVNLWEMTDGCICCSKGCISRVRCGRLTMSTGERSGGEYGLAAVYSLFHVLLFIFVLLLV